MQKNSLRSKTPQRIHLPFNVRKRGSYKITTSSKLQKLKIDISLLSIIRLTPEYHFLPFDCTDGDLNEFLRNDSKNYLAKLLSVTSVIEYNDSILAFFSVSNDKITAQDVKSNRIFENLFKGKMPKQKHFRSYPAVKIGRLAVHKEYQKCGFGCQLLDYIKGMFISNNRTGCQYITVDAYKQSLKFYEKNGFKYLTEDDKEKETRQMYFSLVDLI